MNRDVVDVLVALIDDGKVAVVDETGDSAHLKNYADDHLRATENELAHVVEPLQFDAPHTAVYLARSIVMRLGSVMLVYMGLAPTVNSDPASMWRMITAVAGLEAEDRALFDRCFEETKDGLPCRGLSPMETTMALITTTNVLEWAKALGSQSVEYFALTETLLEVRERTRDTNHLDVPPQKYLLAIGGSLGY